MSDINEISHNETLSDTIKKNIGRNVFEDLDSYNNVMTISQVVKYFNRHGIDTFTKTMIQNYVRVNVLNQPDDKRYYTKNHLFTLAMIDSLKNSFSLDEIKTFFALEDSENNGIDDAGQNNYLTFLDEYNKTITEVLSEAADIESSEHSPTQTQKQAFLLKLMAKSVSYKLMAQSLIELCQ